MHKNSEASMNSGIPGGFQLAIHLKGEWPESSLDSLKELCGSGFSFSSGDLTHVQCCQVLVSGLVTGEDIEKCPGLQTVLVPYAGIPESTGKALSEYPEIKLESIHHNAAATAEMAVALMLAASKLLIPADRALRSSDWSPRYRPDGLIIEDSRVLVLGAGAIGRRVMRICEAMGASVAGIRKNETPGFHTAAQLPVLLPETDILIVCLPLNEDTRGIIGRSQLEQLPRGAVLVNVARGPVIDEEALFDSLSSGHLAAAGIDVWYSYPSSVDSRSNTAPSRFDFGALPNVVMSPHRGGAFGLEGIERRRIHHLACALRKLSGKV